jgi:hypothetical protein
VTGSTFPGEAANPAGAAWTPSAAEQRGSARPSAVVATFTDYASAQRAVDFLSDNRFPVQEVSIVGNNVRLVEHVLGRVTIARAAGAGALSGLWFGLLIGLLLSIFTESGWWAVILTAAAVGAVWGAVFGAIAHAMTRGQRDFRSVSSLQAAEYAVGVPVERADEARQLLARMPAGGTQRP